MDWQGAVTRHMTCYAIWCLYYLLQYQFPIIIIIIIILLFWLTVCIVVLRVFVVLCGHCVF